MIAYSHSDELNIIKTLRYCKINELIDVALDIGLYTFDSKLKNLLYYNLLYNQRKIETNK